MRWLPRRPPSPHPLPAVPSPPCGRGCGCQGNGAQHLGSPSNRLSPGFLSPPAPRRPSFSLSVSPPTRRWDQARRGMRKLGPARTDAPSPSASWRFGGRRCSSFSSSCSVSLARVVVCNADGWETGGIPRWRERRRAGPKGEPGRGLSKRGGKKKGRIGGGCLILSRV